MMAEEQVYRSGMIEVGEPIAEGGFDSWEVHMHNLCAPSAEVRFNDGFRDYTAEFGLGGDFTVSAKGVRQRKHTQAKTIFKCKADSFSGNSDELYDEDSVVIFGKKGETMYRLIIEKQEVGGREMKWVRICEVRHGNPSKVG